MEEIGEGGERDGGGPQRGPQRTLFECHVEAKGDEEVKHKEMERERVCPRV